MPIAELAGSGDRGSVDASGPRVAGDAIFVQEKTEVKGLARVWKGVGAMGALWLCASGAWGQRSARDAASRGAAVTLFVEPQFLHPADGAGSSLGLAGGADFTKFFRTPVLPSLEVRGTYGPTGTSNGEATALVGVRLDLPVLRLGRLHPYGDFLVGQGTIHFANPFPGYLSDNSTVYNYGGGASYDFGWHGLGVQAEFQEQHWNLGNRATATIFSPYAVNAGVRYQIPFGNERTH